MIYYVGAIPYDSDYLEHFGIPGQKWGRRLYQNPDGSLTPAGRLRYQRIAKRAAMIGVGALAGYAAVRSGAATKLIRYVGGTGAAARAQRVFDATGRAARAARRGTVRGIVRTGKAVGRAGMRVGKAIYNSPNKIKTVAKYAKKAGTGIVKGAKFTGRAANKVWNTAPKITRPLIKYGVAIPAGAYVGKTLSQWEKKNPEKTKKIQRSLNRISGR